MKYGTKTLKLLTNTKYAALKYMISVHLDRNHKTLIFILFLDVHGLI